MGRRRNVEGEPSTLTSTNCPGLMSGSGVSRVSFISTYLSFICSTDTTVRSNTYFFITHLYILRKCLYEIQPVRRTKDIAYAKIVKIAQMQHPHLYFLGTKLSYVWSSKNTLISVILRMGRSVSPRLRFIAVSGVRLGCSPRES